MNNFTFYTLVFVWSAIANVLILLGDLENVRAISFLVMIMSVLISTPLQFIGFGIYWLSQKGLGVKSKVYNNSYVKIIFCGFLIAFFVGWSHVYMALDHNPQGAYCEYTTIKSAYTITINGDLCTLNINDIGELWGLHFLICLASALTAIPALFVYKKWGNKWIDRVCFKEASKRE